MVAPLIIPRTHTEGPAPQPAGSHPSDAPPVDSEFAHMLAHDLRSPLTAIQMSADALFAGAEAPAQERYAALIAEQARAIAWSLEDLVALADCETWRATPRRRVDLAALAERCLEELAGLATARDITLLPASGRDAICALGVEPALHQAVRGCARVLIGAAPAGAQVRAAADTSTASDTDRPALLSLTVSYPRAHPPERLDAITLPWDRTPLLAATRIIHEHGGVIRDVRETHVLGLQLVLPSPMRD